MIEAATVKSLANTIKALGDSVISLYVRIEPKQVNQLPKSFILKTRDALRDADVPKNLRDKVFRHINEINPQKRTFVLFVSADTGEKYVHYSFNVDLPINLTPYNAFASIGKPNILPLLAILDKCRKYGVVLVSKKSWRYFEADINEIEERKEVFASIDYQDWRNYSEAKTKIPGIPSRGGAGKDIFDRRLKERIYKFYKVVAREMEKKKNDDIRGIVIIGDVQETHDFVAALKKQFQEKIIRTLQPFAINGNGLQDLFNYVRPVLAENIRERQIDNMAHIRENGISGLENVLIEMQQGKINTFVLPCSVDIIDSQVYFNQNMNYFTTSENQIKKLYPNEYLKCSTLGLLLPDILSEYNTNIEFVENELAEELVNDFGGVGALPRW